MRLKIVAFSVRRFALPVLSGVAIGIGLGLILWSTTHSTLATVLAVVGCTCLGVLLATGGEATLAAKFDPADTQLAQAEPAWLDEEERKPEEAAWRKFIARVRQPREHGTILWNPPRDMRVARTERVEVRIGEVCCVTDTMMRVGILVGPLWAAVPVTDKAGLGPRSVIQCS
jgi:hypothetical protein